MSSDILDIKESPPLKVKRQILPSKDDGFIGSYASSYAGGYTQNVIKTGEELLKQKWIEKLLKEPQEPEKTEKTKKADSETFTGNININVKVLNGMIQQKIESTYKEQLEKDQAKLEAYEKKQREQALLQKLEANKNNLNPIRVDIAP